MTVLINCLGIQDSGGITVLETLLNEIKHSLYSNIIVCNPNDNIQNLVKKHNDSKNIEFLLIPSKSFLHRLYFENIVFRKIIKEKKIDLVYNFSGTAQFFSPVPQISKVHNLLFYSQKIDQVYFEKKQNFKWLKQIFLKKIVFHTLIKQSTYIEVQSEHVKEYMGDFIDLSPKHFFVKSDIKVNDTLFQSPKKYDFTQKLRFLFIVGPHFEYLHKNFTDFVNAMQQLNQTKTDFEIVVTLTKEQLHNSNLWDTSLEEKTSFLGYVSKEILKEQFQDNTILISTSIIETLGLHVIESIQNGILTIVPNEKYALNVYGPDIPTYELFTAKTLIKTIERVALQSNNQIEDIIKKNQNYLIENETKKYQSIVEIFDTILKDTHVQK